MIITPLLEGFGVCAGLIVAIGAQNAFVLKQGIKKQHLFLTAITCFICDGILITLGVTGLGLLISEIPFLVKFFRWGGAIFLIAYGLRSFANAFKPQSLVAEIEKSGTTSQTSTLLALLGFTFLNPHTYIDTFLLLGSVGVEYPPNERIFFIIGTLVASFIWFFGLTYGASALSPLFKKPRTWQILEIVMGCIMIGIALTLIF